jgi:hypothetical protein
MIRRRFICGSVFAVFGSGCLGTEGIEIKNKDLTVVQRQCHTDQIDHANIEFGDKSFTVSGAIVSASGCDNLRASAFTTDEGSTDEQNSVIIKIAPVANQRRNCSECQTAHTYNAKFELTADVTIVQVFHYYPRKGESSQIESRIREER